MTRSAGVGDAGPPGGGLAGPLTLPPNLLPLLFFLLLFFFFFATPAAYEIPRPGIKSQL